MLVIDEAMCVRACVYVCVCVRACARVNAAVMNRSGIIALYLP